MRRICATVTAFFFMLDFSRFSLSNMVECGSALRSLGDRAGSDKVSGTVFGHIDRINLFSVPDIFSLPALAFQEVPNRGPTRITSLTFWAKSGMLTADEIERQMPKLREFLHRMGREAKQGAIGLVIDRDYLEIGFPLEETRPPRPKDKKRGGK